MALRRLTQSLGSQLARNQECMNSTIFGQLGKQAQVEGHHICQMSQQLGGVRYASFQEIKLRMRSVKNIQKITKAMKMVAASKLRRAQNQVFASREMLAPLQRMFGEQANTSAQHSVVIPVTSDKGLCGGINTNIVKAARALMSINASQVSERESTQRLVIVGEKGRSQLQRSSRNSIAATISETQKNPLSFGLASAIADEVLKTEFDKAQVVFNRFVSAASFKPCVATVLSSHALAEDQDFMTKFLTQHIKGTSDKEFLQNISEYSLAATLYQAMAENNCSEHASRVQAMENSTKNATEMIDALTLLYNRTRQSVITKELIEIISGAEALNA